MSTKSTIPRIIFQPSFVISSGGHALMVAALIFNGALFVSKELKLETPVAVSVMSITEFDAMLSESPQNLLLNNAQELKLQTESEKLPSVSQESDLPEIPKIVREPNPKVPNSTFNLENKIRNQETIYDPKIKLESIKKTNSISQLVVKPFEGNEKRSLESPKMSKPSPRAADRIDKIAVKKSMSEAIVDENRKAVQISDEAILVDESSKAETPKESATEIVPEAKKNVEIVVSGAVIKSVPPPSRPDFNDPVKKPDVKPPKSVALLNKTDLTSQIEDGLSQVLLADRNLNNASQEISTFETNHLKLAIKQRLEKYWNMGILIGNSDFEDYRVTIEIRLSREGKIVGEINPVSPRVPSGRYLRAFDQARNAILSAGRLLVDQKSLSILSEDKFAKGLKIELTFDPKKGFSY